MKSYLVAALLAASLSVAIAPSSFAASTAAAATAPAKTVVAKTNAMMAKPAKAAKVDPLRFTTEAAAQTSCAADTVVWANTKSKIFHLQGTATFAKGKNGVFMCEKAASTEGFKPTKKPEKQTS
jgi:hypothetical protein